MEDWIRVDFEGKGGNHSYNQYSTSETFVHRRVGVKPADVFFQPLARFGVSAELGFDQLGEVRTQCFEVCKAVHFCFCLLKKPNISQGRGDSFIRSFYYSASDRLVKGCLTFRGGGE